VHLTSPPVRDHRSGDLAAKLVSKPVVGRDHALRHVQSLYVTDGTRLWMTVVVERLGGERYLLAGMPYVVAEGDRFRRTGELPPVAAAGDLRLTHPPADSPDSFDARHEVTQQQVAFELALDPRGYGNPDEGWSHVKTTTALEAGPAPGAPEGLDVFAVRYGPEATEPLSVECERSPEGLTVRTEALTAVLGEPDAHGEPELTLVRGALPCQFSVLRTKRQTCRSDTPAGSHPTRPTAERLGEARAAGALPPCRSARTWSAAASTGRLVEQ
jgi:hypothetical protein